jgi:hypothetical protein
MIMIFTPSSLQLLEFIDIIVSQRIVLLHAFIHFWIEFVSFSFFKATRNISLMIMIFTPSSLQCKSSNDGIDFINGIMEWFYEKFNCIVYVWIFIWSMNFLLMYFKIPYDFTILRSVFTIRVCFGFSVPCQNHDFNNLEPNHTQDIGFG